MLSNIWTYVGIGLLIWVGWDLYAGYTLAWDVIYRDDNPIAYWAIISVWAAIGVSCFFSSGGNE